LINLLQIPAFLEREEVEDKGESFLTDEKAFDRDFVTSDSIKDEDCFTEEF